MLFRSTIEISMGSQDIGTGTRACIAMVAAETFGVPLTSVLCGSEKLALSSQRYLERIFGAPVGHWYGHSERVVLAGQGRTSAHFYFSPTYGYAEFGAPDADGNRTVGDAVMVESSGCYVQSADRMVAGVGIHDLLVIDTPDALLIADRQEAQKVRSVVDRLKKSDSTVHKIHRTVVRPWGTYTTLEQGPGFKIKRIVVNPGAALSLQMHRHRSEHWVVVGGTAQVVNGDREFVVRANESTFIPAGNRHRLSNRDSEPLVIIEVQTGAYVEEDDIVRLEDVYGRA